MCVLSESRRLPAADRLFTIRTAHGTTWIVVAADDVVTAAGPLVAGWALRRVLGAVLAAAERRGAVVSPCLLPAAVPA